MLMQVHALAICIDKIIDYQWTFVVIRTVFMRRRVIFFEAMLKNIIIFFFIETFRKTIR